MRRWLGSRPRRAALAAASGVLCGVAFWPGSQGWLVWPALAVYWAVTQRGGPWEALGYGWLFGCAGWAAGAYWFPGTVLKFVPGHPAAAGLIYAVMLAGMGSTFAATAFLTRALARALRRWADWHPGAAFLAASAPALVAVEGYFPQLFPAVFSISQFWHLPFLQSCDLVGAAAAAWLAASWTAAASLLARVLLGTGRARGGTRRLALAALAGASLLVGANELYGLWRLREVARGLRAAVGLARRAAVVQGSIPDQRRFRPERFAENLAVMSALTRATADAGASLVVWPENTYERELAFDWRDQAFAQPRVGAAPAGPSLAADVPVPVDVVLGAQAVVTSGPPAAARTLRRHYAAVLKRADGRYGGFSAKGMPTPFGEFIPGGDLFPGLYTLAPFLVRVAPGPQPVLRLSDGAGLGAFICYDAIRPGAARNLTRRGAALLAELTSDAWWFDDRVMPEQTLRLSRLRAIENRRFLLRALTTGVSAVIDPAGRVVSSLAFGARGSAAADVIPLSALTLSTRLGPLGYEASLLLLGGLVLLAGRRGGRGAFSCLLGLLDIDVPAPRPDLREACRFAAPNEESPRDALPILRRAPRGVYVAVGAERGFLAAAATPAAEGLVLLDADAGVCRFNELNRALLAAAADRAHYRRLRLEAGPDEWREAGLRAEDHAWWRRTLAYRPRGLEERVRCRSFAAFHAASNAAGRFAGAHYLTDDALFARLREWARAGRLQVRRLDLADAPAWEALVAELHDAGTPLSALDVSNAWQPEYMRAESFARALAVADAWAGPESVLLTTAVSPPWRWPGRWLRGEALPWDYRGITFRALRAHGDRSAFARSLSWSWLRPAGTLADVPPARRLAASRWEVRLAGQEDVAGILAVLASRAEDSGLMGRSETAVRASVGTFVVARGGGEVLGCAALETHGGTSAEVVTVAVRPEHEGNGVGAALVAACERLAREGGRHDAWLATRRPDYFARLGYRPFPRLELPWRVWATKAAWTFAQPPRRWLPTLSGRFTFMRKEAGT